jgi:hypothetical protein
VASGCRRSWVLGKRIDPTSAATINVHPKRHGHMAHPMLASGEPLKVESGLLLLDSPQSPSIFACEVHLRVVT